MTANDILNIDFQNAPSILQDIINRYNRNTFYGFNLSHLVLEFVPTEKIVVKFTI